MVTLPEWCQTHTLEDFLKLIEEGKENMTEDKIDVTAPVTEQDAEYAEAFNAQVEDTLVVTTPVVDPTKGLTIPSPKQTPVA